MSNQQQPFSYYCPFCAKLEIPESEIIGVEGRFRHQICENYLEIKDSGTETADDIDVYSKRIRDQMSEYANGLRGLVREQEKSALESFVKFIDEHVLSEDPLKLASIVEGSWESGDMSKLATLANRLGKIRVVIEKFKLDNATHLEPLVAKFPLCPTCRVELGDKNEINYQCPNCSKLFVKGLTPKRKEP